MISEKAQTNFKNNETNKTFRNNLTHFINISIEDNSFIQAYSNFKNQFEGKQLKDFYPELMQTPTKLHMTVCVLELREDEEKIKKVHNSLTEIEPGLKKIVNNKLSFEFDKFELFGNIKETRVIYARMKENEDFYKILEINNLIFKKLIEIGILDDNLLKKNHIEYDTNSDKYYNQLHMTIFNVSFLRKMKGKKNLLIK